MLSGLNPDLPIRLLSRDVISDFPYGNLLWQRVIPDALPGTRRLIFPSLCPASFWPDSKRILTINLLHRRHWQT
jgi:hypothetical protein